MEEFKITREKSADRLYISLATKTTGVALEWRAEAATEFVVTGAHFPSESAVGVMTNARQVQQFKDALDEMQAHVRGQQ